MTSMPRFTVQQPHAREVLASGFSGMEHKGIFYCHLMQGSNPQTTVTLISNYIKGKSFYRFLSIYGSPRERGCGYFSSHIVAFC